ncbi:BTAD domain-containing putative transcriptional regulator [Phytohabitans sp. ZYX-F-186]|uniref:BTAD domain-containing putative transcriptional regulator n=1 Tax=Phytohabitans maris TaxID=3071409 RepID=A0ABU0ZST8_9ACTN|nr:BTAD domain-containing putative transcriptional regulator [Phytohabitans sp. ZYX-F-186]MDQ7909290.1 BTAD domain-containing putative transcriptional regulator [Phytohabitans sp. ZYX-F-186]
MGEDVDVRYGVLGATQVLGAGGVEVPVGAPRARALLALLLLDAGRIVPAERLIDGLYGDSPPSGAANALQSQVSRLRQAVGEYAPIEFHPAGYRLAVEPDDVDAHRFTRLAAEGQRALGAGDLAGAVASLREALELWRGPALVDAPYATGQAARLEELRLTAVEDRVEAELGLGGGSGQLVAELRDVVGAHPLRERPRALLMRALYAAGRPAEALAAYDDARQVFADELGTDPSPEMAALHVAILRDEVARPPELPAQLTSFVGREEELRRVGKLLGEARLVTLHGPGGAGKTRLAVEAAGRQEGEVCFVELAALPPQADRSPGQGGDVARAVLRALGLREASLRGPGDPRDAAERLVAALADRRLLVVLDNCEHVVAETARLAARILAAAPGVRVLATSREPLGITGEALCPVFGLAVPPAAAPEGTGTYPAVRLFVERAGDAVPGFALDDSNVDDVLRVVRTLDGLPLAIELAAARLRALPVAEVAARLDDRFRLLTRGSRAAQPRHQTLRAVVEWSWDLLDEAERRLARRLTVFAGGATLDAAERVCGADLDVLAGLVDKSLVVAAGGRYRMLETVRAFCGERLAEAGEVGEFSRAHAAYYLELAREADPHLRRAEQLEWLRRLDGEREDLRAALARAADDDPPTGMRLLAALSFYWWLRGLRTEGSALAARLLAAVGPEPPEDLVEEYALCAITAHLGGVAGVPLRPWTTEQLLPVLRRPPRQPFLLYLSAMATGPPAEGPLTMPEMVERWGAIFGDDPWLHALGGIGSGLMHVFHQRVDPARREIADALAGFRAIGERWGMMLALAAMAEFADGRGDHAAAAAPMDEALRLARELGSTVDMADLLRTRGDGLVQAGALDRARADYERSAALARRAGVPEMVAAGHLGLAEVARRRGDLPVARQWCAEALAACPAGWFSADATRFGLLVAAARIARAEGDEAAARDWYRRALAAPAGVRTMPAFLEAVEGLVGLSDPTEASLLLGAAAAAEALPREEARARAADPAAFARGAGLSRSAALAALSAA